MNRYTQEHIDSFHKNHRDVQLIEKLEDVETSTIDSASVTPQEKKGYEESCDRQVNTYKESEVNKSKEVNTSKKIQKPQAIKLKKTRAKNN